MARCSCGMELPPDAEACSQCGTPAKPPVDQSPGPPPRKVGWHNLIDAIGLFVTAGLLGIGGLSCIVLTVAMGDKDSAWPLGLFAILIAALFVWFGKKRLERHRD